MNFADGQLDGRLAIGGAALLLFLSAGWTWSRHRQSEPLRRAVALPELRGGPHQPTPPAPPAVAPPAWEEGWVNDERSGGRFRLFGRPPGGGVARTPEIRATDTGPDLELLAVVPEPFRLQLAGYLETPGGYLVAFRQVEGGETVLGRVGSRLEEAEAVLREFSVEPGKVAGGEAGESDDLVARALLLDERSGLEVELTDREPALAGTGVAVVRLRGDDAARRMLRAGESVHAGGSSLQVERIQVEPPEVVLRSGTNGPAALRVLRPVASERDRMAAGAEAGTAAASGSDVATR